MKKRYLSVLLVLVLACSLFGCGEYDEMAYSNKQDAKNTLDIGNKLSYNQATPTDIDYSLERYNLIKRAYWVNGQEEKAKTLPCPVDKPLGYIVLFAGNTVVSKFVVDGKVSSLNSYLTPDSELYEGTDSCYKNRWLPDVDGSYGENDTGIFFFTVDGHYKEWTGDYLYSDTPMTISDPIVKTKEQ